MKKQFNEEQLKRIGLEKKFDFGISCTFFGRNELSENKELYGFDKIKGGYEFNNVIISQKTDENSSYRKITAEDLKQ